MSGEGPEARMYDGPSSVMTTYSKASPANLQTLCLHVVCNRLEDLCVRVQAGATDTPFPDVFPPQFTVLRFSLNEAYFHSGIAERILTKLGEDGKLRDDVMTLFDSRVMHLKKIRIVNASHLGAPGLKSLRGHKVTELEVIGLSKATVTDLIASLNEWSVQNLRILNVSDCTFTDQSKHVIAVALSKLRNLQSLNVAGTEFNSNCLEMVVDDLPLLEHLDISLTKVNNICSLRKCKHRLKSLVMHGLKPATNTSDAMVDILSQLHELLSLDISETHATTHTLSSIDENMGKINANDLLSRRDILPHLTSLDISGRREVQPQTIRTFLQSHPQLRFLGLVFVPACWEASFDSYDFSDANPLLRVGGGGCEGQVVESLQRYSDRRPEYTQNALYNLFRLTDSLVEPRIDLIRLVILAAKRNRNVFVVQMAATACFYNLSKGSLGEKLHPDILRDIVQVDLDAMEQFPEHQQLQKNALLTICNDRILQEVNFDRFRCARLVLDCLHAFPNHTLNRMSVAICSILAAKITTRETSQLGSKPNYMKKLLKLVAKRAKDGTVDVTLKFTLSTLWNLTDESPTTCSVFLEAEGLQLFIIVLQTFPDDTSVQTKVLGLLNNIAEVKTLRSSLMDDRLFQLLRGLLHSTHIDVSYFAAGIIAHLASDRDTQWTITCINKEAMMQDLFNVVLRWRPPKEEMVAYRSFKPFYSLMSVDQSYAVQLWAVWAIQQVCSKNAERYGPMLEETGVKIICRLMRHPATRVEVATICKAILQILFNNGYLARLVNSLKRTLKS